MLFQMKSTLLSNFSKSRWSLFNFAEILRKIHLSQRWSKLEERRTVRTSKKRDEGTEGEVNVGIDQLNLARQEIFPDEDTPNKLFNNIPFSQIPVCNIKVSKNNTIISIADAKSGDVKLLRTCGAEGFKNTRKGTNIAAQATAITIGTNALNRGYTQVRVRLSGLGPGRMSALKGLQMAGVNIVSVTDSTPVSWNPPRPRKQRRL